MRRPTCSKVPEQTVDRNSDKSKSDTVTAQGQKWLEKRSVHLTHTIATSNLVLDTANFALQIM
jgi:hypothetical protein